MKVNDSPGICIHCKETVHPKEGYIQRSPATNSWKIIHKECYRLLAAMFLTEKQKR